MTKNEVRQALTAAFLAAVQAEGITYDVQYENRTNINTDSQTDPFLIFEIAFGPSYRMDIGYPAKVRTVATVTVGCCVKEGQGTKLPLEAVEAICERLEIRDIGSLRMRSASQQEPSIQKGWYCHHGVIPFEYDRLANSVN